ncbi:hypothetical protein [Treponema sp.]|uniref:hypothetical protein n=1 Tax=Treponema sp. TaxID=166 RepID=UPI0025FCF021|nr:hypothetical protein [Treponema sp.]MCR5218551.1 hypothetical protein [Treponema sp.]
MKIPFLLLIPALSLFISCNRPVQWKQKKAACKFEFLTFEKNTPEKTVRNKLKKWDIDFDTEKGKLFTCIEADWITFEKIEYSQIFLYFNDKEELFKVRAYIPGQNPGKKLLNMMNKRYTESRHRGQKPREHYFTGVNEENASLKYNKDDEVWLLEINFSPT